MDEEGRLLFVINSLVYPWLDGPLYLIYPEFSTRNIGRFSPTIEVLNDLSLVPKSIIEEVQKTMAGYESILLDNHLKKLDELHRQNNYSELPFCLVTYLYET